MNVDSVKQYVALKAALKQEKAQLESRLAAINQALNESSSSAAVPAVARSLATIPKRRGRAANKLSLKEVVALALKAGPLSKPAILAAVAKLGYTFTASDPMNSLNTLLYTPGNFKNLGGGQWTLKK